MKTKAGLMRKTKYQWIKSLPNEWQLKPLKHSVKINSEALPESTPHNLSIKYVDIGNVNSLGQVKEPNEMLFENAPSRARRVVRSGDTILSTVRTYLKAVAFIDFAEPNLIASTGFAVLRPNRKDLSPQFLYYIVSSEPFIQAVSAHSVGVSYPAINSSDLGILPFWFPSIDEQKAIIGFLDRKITLIDDLIAKKERQIELLNEKRQALISHAVTKGLNKDAPMRFSGLAWLPKIPENWTVKPLKFVSPSISVGIVITPSKYYVESGVPCLRSLNVKEGYLTNEDLVFISKESNDELSKSKIYLGDIVAVRTGQPGTTAQIDERFDGANCIDLIIIRQSKTVVSDFLVYLLNSCFAKEQFGAGSGGAIQQHFNIETAQNLQVVIPPINDQLKIVRFLSETGKDLCSQIEKIKRQFFLLQEYRTTLISAAVTGKIDVQN
ncbi:MAG: restriction endonuclease subunit S [Candidatus Riflebacteria bacterium]|nr:restriction endonuclease subunit S [Candidatus Riflebacteria bacterium]